MADFSKTCLEYSTVVFAKIASLALAKGVGATSQPFLSQNGTECVLKVSCWRSDQ